MQYIAVIPATKVLTSLGMVIPLSVVVAAPAPALSGSLDSAQGIVPFL